MADQTDKQYPRRCMWNPSERIVTPVGGTYWPKHPEAHSAVTVLLGIPGGRLI